MMRSPNSLSSGRSSRNALPYCAADVLAVDEHARIGAQRVADAEHDRVEEGAALRIERRRGLDAPAEAASAAAIRRCPLQRTVGIEHLDVDARLLVLEHADAGLRRLRPRRVDDRARLALRPSPRPRA